MRRRRIVFDIYINGLLLSAPLAMKCVSDDAILHYSQLCVCELTEFIFYIYV
jgi:hypothetical protein